MITQKFYGGEETNRKSIIFNKHHVQSAISNWQLAGIYNDDGKKTITKN
jgi:hypothetical protein